MSTIQISTPHSTHQVDEGKLTTLGLYVTAREAYEMWLADPERAEPAVCQDRFSHGYIKNDFDVNAWAGPEFLEQAATEVFKEEWKRRS